MGDSRSLGHVRSFQLNWPSAKMIEQPDTSAQQEGHQIDTDLVKQAELDALLGNARARYIDIPVLCGLLRPANGALNAICHEREWRSLVEPRLWGGVGHDKTRPVS